MLCKAKIVYRLQKSFSWRYRGKLLCLVSTLWCCFCMVSYRFVYGRESVSERSLRTLTIYDTRGTRRVQSEEEAVVARNTGRRRLFVPTLAFSSCLVIALYFPCFSSHSLVSARPLFLIMSFKFFIYVCVFFFSFHVNFFPTENQLLNENRNSNGFAFKCIVTVFQYIFEFKFLFNLFFL